MKRFYTSVDAAKTEHGFAIHLDGRPVKTPAGHTLSLPNAALAEVIAQEWRDQGETVRPETMAATRIANAALDRAPEQRADFVAEMIKHAETELICMRASHPAELAARQAAEWNPVLEWLVEYYDISLCISETIKPPAHDPDALARLRDALDALDDFPLVGVFAAAGGLESTALALALYRGRLTAEQAFAASRIDETYQQDMWGQDEEAGRREESMLQELMAIERYMRAL